MKLTNAVGIRRRSLAVVFLEYTYNNGFIHTQEMSSLKHKIGRPGPLTSYRHTEPSRADPTQIARAA